MLDAMFDVVGIERATGVAKLSRFDGRGRVHMRNDLSTILVGKGGSSEAQSSVEESLLLEIELETGNCRRWLDLHAGRPLPMLATDAPPISKTEDDP